MFYVKSRIEWIESIGNIPFIGFLFVVVMSAFPGAILAIISLNFYEFTDDQFQLLTLTAYPFWNLFFIWKNVKIFLFYIRADIFWLILGLCTFVFKIT